MSSFVNHLERQHVRKASIVKALAVQAEKERRLCRSRQPIDLPPVAVPEDTFTCFLIAVGESDEELVLERDEHLGRLLLSDPLHDLVVGVHTPAVEVGEDWPGPSAHLGYGLLVEVATLAVADANYQAGRPD